MNNESINKCIGCTVRSCKNHAQAEDYCTLRCVSIGTHEPHPTEPQCVDCESFMPQSGM
ncbi:MAG: DUF1540 domain-containing protein [Clostridia bacterium]|nr:DUF1540 domain-containing protein [Clostridia bacterium]MBR3554128.1 DUF1540 domain-containing protein [Clostridia bacterium]